MCLNTLLDTCFFFVWILFCSLISPLAFCRKEEWMKYIEMDDVFVLYICITLYHLIILFYSTNNFILLTYIYIYIYNESVEGNL